MVKLPETLETTYDFTTLSSTSDWLKTADLSECRIWLEMTEGDVTYAVNAEYKEAFQAPTVYAMNIGTAPLYKVSYGWNEADGVQVSYGSESALYHVLDKDAESVLLHGDGREAMPFASSGNQWSGSAAETWLNDSYYTTAFSELERSAIKSTTLSERADYTIRRTNYNDKTAEDHIFLLSAYEADKLYEDACERKQDASWWLRSADSADGTKAATVNTEGRIESSPVTTDQIKVSPAFRLDLSDVLFTTAKDVDKKSSVSARNAKAYTGAKIWKLTLKDDRKTIGVQENQCVSRYPDRTIEVPYQYTDNASGEEKVNQISVMITDKKYEDEGAKIQYYGALQGLGLSPESAGTGTFMLPSTLGNQTLGTDYHLYLLAEHVSDAGATDYASAPYEITEFRTTSTLDISSIEVTGITKPVAGEKLDTEATCTTEHVSVKNISWKTSTGKPVTTTTAGYYTGYNAYITLQADDGYAFNDAITSGTARAKVVYIDAAGQEHVTSGDITEDSYRTVIVIAYFNNTEKDKLESITAPEPLYVSNGTSWDDIAGQLPKKIAIVTKGKSASKEDVTWDTSEAKNRYDQSSTERQAFTLIGEVNLWNIDPNGVDCTVKMDVIVKAKNQVEEPKADPAGGSYTENQKVSLTSATEGAAIYYTMDGSKPALVNGEPDGNTKKYVTPIDVSGLEGQNVTITIKAIAVKEGMPDSEITTYVYHINKPIKEIAEVAVTGIDAPAAGKALDTTADCATEGVSVESVEWKTSDLNTGVTTAGYETSYAVLVKLKANDGHVFSPDVTGTVNGAVAGVETDLTNTDGTITAVTVWIKFARTGRDKLVSITAPSSRVVKNGTAYENMGLPTTVAIVTEGQTVTTAAVAWDTRIPAAGSYDPALETEQTVTLNGTVTCPDAIDPNGVSLATTITITIRAIDATSHFITVSSGDAGSVSPDGMVEVPDGGSQTFTITPNEGYEVDAVKVDGNNVGAVTSYTFEGVTADHMLEALFKQSSAPVVTPAPTETPVPTENPAPMATPEPTETPAPAETPAPTAVPTSSEESEATAAPVPTATPAPVKTSMPAKAPAETPAPEAYRILDGADSKWVQDEDGSVIIRGNGEFSKFTGVRVDGELIDEENYTASEGSTIITLKKEYLATLSEGIHSFEILWTDGSAHTNFTVAKSTAGSQENSGNAAGSGNQEPSETGIPADSENTAEVISQTDEGGSGIPWVILVIALVVLAGTAGVIIFRQRQDT